MRPDARALELDVDPDPRRRLAPKPGRVRGEPLDPWLTEGPLFTSGHQPVVFGVPVNDAEPNVSLADLNIHPIPVHRAEVPRATGEEEIANLRLCGALLHPAGIEAFQEIVLPGERK